MVRTPDFCRITSTEAPFRLKSLVSVQTASHRNSNESREYEATQNHGKYLMDNRVNKLNGQPSK